MPSKTLDFASLEGSSRYRQLPSPPGFSRSLATSKGPSKSSMASTAAYDQLKERRAWDMAIAPAKSLSMFLKFLVWIAAIDCYFRGWTSRGSKLQPKVALKTPPRMPERCKRRPPDLHTR
ncbi:uncharacterized protein ARMOST_10615 [Armillaria ostoyae]|uniref:Uncharacterized protein n=1 Tax=Armillaria ostoyae TaxID=47428 RepID=A0A284REV3_ARMOS|nr:uncharacterized protein ARMOST_10615 [Armillaria ostoyae]